MTAEKSDRKTEGLPRRKAGISASPRHDRTTKYHRSSKAISGRLHDEMVMMDLDQGKYFSLNPVATRIWDLLGKSVTLDELCGLLMDEYDVEKEQCRGEVSEHLNEMVRMGLIMRNET